MGIRMIATKDMTYATRRLKAGDEIADVSGPNARLLAALGRARRVEPGETKKEVQAEVQTENKAALRAEYLRVVGKKAFNGWDAETLRAKIAAAAAKD